MNCPIFCHLSVSKKLKSIEIGSNITEIAEGAFDGIRSDATFRLKMTKKRIRSTRRRCERTFHARFTANFHDEFCIVGIEFAELLFLAADAFFHIQDGAEQGVIFSQFPADSRKRAIAKHIFDLFQGAFFVVIVQERKLRRKNGIHDIHFAVMFNFHIRFREHARRKMRRGRDGSLHRVGVDAHGVALIFKGGLQTVLRNPLAEIGTHFFFEEFPVRREALGLYGPGVPLMRRKLTDG